jgi:hypothetical protein
MECVVSCSSTRTTRGGHREPQTHTTRPNFRSSPNPGNTSTECRAPTIQANSESRRAECVEQGIEGAASGSLYAICEALYEPDLDGDALVSLTKKCMSLAMQRDVMSGGRCSLYLLKADGIEKFSFETDDSW